MEKFKKSKIVEITKKFGNQDLIVRSSSFNEDNKDESNAGKFSITYVGLNNLEESIEKVIKSYSYSED